MSDPLMKHHRNHSDLVPRDGRPGLRDERALDRRGIEDHGGGGLSRAADFDAGPDSVQVRDRSPAGNENQVRRLSRLERRTRRVRCGVDDGKVRSSRASRRQQRGELGSASRNDDGCIGRAEPGPGRGRPLRVKVHQGRREARLLARDRQPTRPESSCPRRPSG